MLLRIYMQLSYFKVEHATFCINVFCMRFEKLNQKAFSAILITALALLSLAAYFGDSDNFLVGNLTPELMGVCIELLIILWVFDRWQENSKKKKLVSLERRLREYLIFFLKHSFKNVPQEYRVGRFFGKDHEKNIEQIDNLIQYVKSNGLDEAALTSIQQHCMRESRTLENLLPVASELTNEHFKAWCRIVYFINSIAGSQEPISKSTIDILQNIKRFDSESFKRKLYVDGE